MATTPNYGFPYPGLTDVPNIPADIAALAVAVDTEIARVDADAAAVPWTNYTPAWTSGGTAPVLNNGTLKGSYLILGSMCQVRVFFQAGSTTSFGTGTYAFSLPFTAASPAGLTSAVWVGSALLRDQGGTPGRYVGVCTVDAGASVAGVLGEGGNLMTNNDPFTWANTDYMSFSVAYEIP